MPTEKTDLEISVDGSEKDSEFIGKELEELVRQSGMLTNIDMPGINHMKQKRIDAYVNEIVLVEGLDVSNVQILSKDNGGDIRVTIYNKEAIHSQINYSQIP